jgi:hypothetical protein
VGRRGPLPSKSLVRRKSHQKIIDAQTTVGALNVDVEAPYEPDEKWHQIAASLYDSVQHSGQAKFYTESDWTKLYLLCDQLSQNLQPQFVGMAKDWKVIMVDGEERLVQYQKPIAGIVPMNGATLNALQSVMTSLGISEGDRRRMGIELVHKQEESDDEAAAQARQDAALVEAMQTGNVVPMKKSASGE